MLVTSADVASLDALLIRWESAEYVATVFVILACVGEFVAEFTEIRTKEWRDKLGKMSLLVLIAALSLELVSLVRTNNLSGREIALLGIDLQQEKQRTATAESNSAQAQYVAAKANERAGKLEKEAAELLRDPWAARNDYIDVVLNRADENVADFLGKHAARDLNREDQIRALKMLEMQRHAMLMYTSCGWFFDELSGLETVQVVQYAGRAIQLARETTGTQQLEAQFCEKLREAKSNVREYGNGEEIYKKWVAPAIVTADKVMGHYAISSLFESYGDKTKIYCYTVEREQYGVETEGRVRLAVGRGRVRSEITKEQTPISFAVLFARSLCAAAAVLC